MRGTMMDFPLVLPVLLERARKLFPDIELVSHRPDKTQTRSTYGSFYERSRRLSKALRKLGLQRGDRVASLLWNHSTHLEAFIGFLSSFIGPLRRASGHRRSASFFGRG